MALDTTLAPAWLNPILNSLDPEQCAAATLPDGPAQIVAPAGSGKTATLVARIGVLLARGVPALARADVGIAIGAGTDVAVESAVIVLVSDDPRDVIGAIRLSKASYAKMIQNLWWAAGYNIAAIPLAAGILAPIGITLPMSVGALMMSLSTIVVAANAQLLRGLKLRAEPAN